MERPRLSFWQIWNMSFGFFGIQFGWGLQMANMSAIYEYLGASQQEIAWLWIAAPLTGLIVQPIIGYASDRTWGRLGRRRPYLPGGGCPLHARPDRHAEFVRRLDGRRTALDPRCEHQYHDGAVPGIRRRHVAAEPAQDQGLPCRVS